jgi:ubiquinone/menaquinone biosynthesis C-methylase UbiE
MNEESSGTKFVIDSEFEKRSKGSFYNRFYAKVTDNGIKWRDFGAIEKCESILELCSGLRFDKVVEIGCGFCSIISRLDKLKFAPEFYALEVSPSIIRFIQEKINIPSLKSVYLLDTTKTPFENDFFDLGIVSHVLEHVPTPNKLLNETLRICKYALLEVPLDDCLSANLEAKFLEKLTGRRRRDNPTGHINVFNESTFEKLIRESGGQILRKRTYRPWKVFFIEFRPIILLNYIKSILLYLVFKATNSRVVTIHYAVLITKRAR